jgi:hypothetical protein
MALFTRLLTVIVLIYLIEYGRNIEWTADHLKFRKGPCSSKLRPPIPIKLMSILNIHVYMPKSTHKRQCQSLMLVL